MNAPLISDKYSLSSISLKYSLSSDNNLADPDSKIVIGLMKIYSMESNIYGAINRLYRKEFN